MVGQLRALLVVWLLLAGVSAGVGPKRGAEEVDRIGEPVLEVLSLYVVVWTPLGLTRPLLGQGA